MAGRHCVFIWEVEQVGTPNESAFNRGSVFPSVLGVLMQWLDQDRLLFQLNFLMLPQKSCKNCSVCVQPTLCVDLGSVACGGDMN